MKKEKISKNEAGEIKAGCCNSKMQCLQGCCCGRFVYGLGFVGALVHYVLTADNFGMGVLGVLKAIVWPVFAVMKILGL